MRRLTLWPTLESFITYSRAACHVAAFFAGDNEAIDKGLFVSTSSPLANLGLSMAVFVAEYQAAGSWKDYRESETSTSVVGCGLSKIAGIGSWPFSSRRRGDLRRRGRYR